MEQEKLVSEQLQKQEEQQLEALRVQLEGEKAQMLAEEAVKLEAKLKASAEQVLNALALLVHVQRYTY